MTKFEVLLCIYYYLDKEYLHDKNKSGEYIAYISGINPDLWTGEGTSDPAYYADYLEICDSFFEGAVCSLEEGLRYAKKYLEEYNTYEHSRYSSNIDEAAAVFSKCTLSEWETIYNWVKNRQRK